MFAGIVSLNSFSFYLLIITKIFEKEPFFFGADNHDMITKQAKIVGSETLRNYIHKYNIPVKKSSAKLIKNYPSISLNRFVKSSLRSKANPDAVDLLQKMLVVDHAERILPREAM